VRAALLDAHRIVAAKQPRAKSAAKRKRAARKARR